MLFRSITVNVVREDTSYGESAAASAAVPVAVEPIAVVEDEPAA